MEKIIKVQVTRTFTKTATIELALPSIIPLDMTEDYIFNTEDTWRDAIEEQLAKTELESDPELDKARFDVYEQVLLEKQVYGGTLYDL